ncbi:MAG TPA: efflux RND transporter periplasmic adaptor subunit [Bryobacteraceae bacterium]|nr:efflux RND transporter periplasmic adaptor subunit [Bryobacteraceae bacterium]
MRLVRRQMRQRLGLAAFYLFALLAGCSRNEQEKLANTPPPVKAPDDSAEVRLPADSPMLTRIKVSTVQSALQPLDEVVAPGKIEANPNRISRVAMPLAGRVTKVMVGIGDAVVQGQPLLAVHSPDVGTASSNYRQAQARANQAKAALAKAEADLGRTRDLYANRAIAQKEVLSAQAAVAQSQADVEQALAATDESLQRLQIFGVKPGQPNQEVRVLAPLAGKVLEISVAAGEYRNDTSAPLMTIADLSMVYMAADVPESQIRLIHQGERVEITLGAYPGEVFEGRVARIADTVDAQTRTIKVRAELNNARQRFRPDMFGEIRHQENFRGVPVVPPGAIIQGDQQSIVYRESSRGVFTPVAVKFGKQQGEAVPVLSGLNPGDRIVTDGAMLLRGSR